jgi:hypothetical protein
VDLQQLQEELRRLEAIAIRTADVQAIEKLQRIYGYYLDNHMYDEAVELFTEDARFELVDTGTYFGKSGVARFLQSMTPGPPEEARKHLSLHMQLQGVVDVEENGHNAKGRWQCLIMIGSWAKQPGSSPPPSGLPPTIGQGVYENEYTKEGGIWRISRLRYSTSFWSEAFKHDAPEPDAGTSIGDTTYPTGFFLPHHFDNPVSKR